jgi:hypothetical protein
VAAETWAVLEHVELLEKGLAPVAGGALDQAAAFLEAARLVWSEDRAAKARQKRSAD